MNTLGDATGDAGVGNIVETPRTDRGHPRLRAAAEVAIMAALVLFGLNLLFANARNANDGMQPLLHTGDRVLADRLAYLLGAPRRGDLALVREPGAQSEVVVRRVIALPGEKVAVRGRQILVNDRVLDEPYLAPAAEPLNFTAEYRLKDNEYLLLSDSRETQAGFNDSRRWGAVSADRLIGRALLVYWPLEGIRLLPGVSYAGDDAAQ